MGRRGAQILAVWVAVALAQPARAEEPAVVAPHERGALTGVGLALMAATLLGTGVGIAGVAGANEGSASLAYYQGSVPQAEAPAAAGARARYITGIVQASVSFVLAAAALVGSIVCFVVDGKPAAVSFVPTPQGAAFAFSLVW